MNVACSSCPAKYAVPDEKVRGRKVRITCKRCGAPIIVDGTQPAALDTGATAPAASPATGASPPSNAPGGDAAPPSKGDAAAGPAAASKPAAQAPKTNDEAPAQPAAAPAPAAVAAAPPAVDGAPKRAASSADAKASAASGAKGGVAATKLPAVSKLGEAKAAAFPRPGALSGKTLGGVGTMRASAAKAGGATAASAESPAESPAAPAEKPAPTPSGGKVAAIPVATRGAAKAGAAVTPAAGAAAQRSVAAVPRAGAAARAIAPSALPERTWTVAVTDEQHQEMTLAQIVDAYAAHTIDAETFVWRDGMQDWLMPFEIAEIAAALRARRLSPRTNEAATGSTEAAPFGEEMGSGAWREPGRWDRDEPPPSEANFDDVTVAMAAPKAQALLEAVAAEDAAAAAGPKSDDPTALGTAPALTMAALGFGEDDAPTAGAPDGASAASAGEPGERQPEKLPFELAPSALPGRAALRSDGAEGGGKRDLFARRNEEEDAAAAEAPASEAPVSVAAESEGADGAAATKTGARNESSVLFSLDQLAKKETKAAPNAKKKSDEAAILLGGSDSPVGIAPAAPGGLFGQTSMAAPDFTAPPPPSVPPPAPGKATPSGSPAPAASKSNTGLWIALIVLVVAGAGAAVLFTRSPAPPPSPEPTSSPQAAQPATVAEPATAAPAAPSSSAADVPAASAAAAPADSAAAPAASAMGSAPGASASAASPAAAGSAPATAPAASGAAPRPQTPAAPKPSAAAAPAAAEGPDFDKDAASAALATAAARAESECASQEGTHGTAKVAVTFANSGRATNALVSGDFAGSPLGGCVAKVFRSVKVPAFGGDQVRVSKTVRIP